MLNYHQEIFNFSHYFFSAKVCCSTFCYMPYLTILAKKCPFFAVGIPPWCIVVSWHGIHFIWDKTWLEDDWCSSESETKGRSRNQRVCVCLVWCHVLHVDINILICLPVCQQFSFHFSYTQGTWCSSIVNLNVHVTQRIIIIHRKSN